MENELTLEQIVARYGRALAVIDDETGELKVAGMSAHSVDINGKPKRGVRRPKNNGWSPEEPEDEEDVFEKSITDSQELKMLGYLNSMSDEEFDIKFPEEKDEQSADELKWVFDTLGAFARRALTNRRRKRKREVFKKTENDESVENVEAVISPVEEKAAKRPLRDPKGGLTAAGRAHFKRTEGANLKPGVKGRANTPEKLRRKGSFLTRFFTNPSGPMKDDKGRPTRLALSAAAWGEPVPQNAQDAAALAAKGRRLLERYENAKKSKKKK